ncbi:MAG: S8 family serine peptidase [Acidobacteriota bacterium]|nr:S8 family serine peptidase [Acidobacteriota bacterium]
MTIRKVTASHYDALNSSELAALEQHGIVVREDYGPFALGTRATTTDVAAASRASGLLVISEPSFNKLSVGGVEIDTRPGAPSVPGIAPTLRLADYPVGGDGLYLIQLAGPPRPAWLSELSSAGLTTLRYVETNGYLVRAPAGLRALKERLSSVVKFIAPYEPFEKLSPELRSVTSGEVQILVVWDSTETLASAASKVLALDPSARLVPSSRESYAVLKANPSQFGALAADAHVLSMEIPHEGGPSDERTAQIAIGNISGDGASGTGYMDALETACSSCFHDMSSEVVDVVDSGLYAHPDLSGGVPGRLTYASAFMGVTGGTVDQYFHGTFVTGLIAGNPFQANGTHNAGDGGFAWGLGVAPTVHFMNSRIFDNQGHFVRAPTPADVDTLSANAFNHVAMVQNNSWNVCDTTYTTLSRAYDIHVRDALNSPAQSRNPLSIVFSSGNMGNCDPASAPVTAPANAKNVITVGASSFMRPALVGNCDTTHGVRDVSDFSRRGIAAAAGRFKPDLVAASTSSTSAVSSPYVPAGCGGANLIDANYYADNGTSFSAPLVTGATVLLKRRIGGTPSPALTKAVLLGSAASMNGGVDQFTLNTLGWEPASPQGFGRLNVQAIVSDATPARYVDEDTSPAPIRRFTASGQYYEQTLNIADVNLPVIIVLAYSDAPSMENSVGNAVNILNMAVYNGSGWSWNDGNTGSQFAPPCIGGLTEGCYLHDTVNNVKWIKIAPNSVYPSFTIQVVASSLAAKAVPELDSGASVNQDWAMYVYNAY